MGWEIVSEGSGDKVIVESKSGRQRRLPVLAVGKSTMSFNALEHNHMHAKRAGLGVGRR